MATGTSIVAGSSSELSSSSSLSFSESEPEPEPEPVSDSSEPDSSASEIYVSTPTNYFAMERRRKEHTCVKVLTSHYSPEYFFVVHAFPGAPSTRTGT